VKIVATFIACYLLPVTLLAQIDDAQQYADSITGADLKKHLIIIAGAEMEGRETATPGQRKAAAYIEDQFKLTGLQAPQQLSGYQQLYPIYKDTLINTSLKIRKTNYQFGKDFISNTSAAQTREIRSKKIIFIGYGISDINYDDYKDKNVKNKIVIFFTGEPKVEDKYIVSGTGKSSTWSFPGISKKTALARQKGAAAAFVINPAMENISQVFVESSRRSNIYLPDEKINENEKVNYTTILPSVASKIFGGAVFNALLLKAKAGEPLNKINIEVKAKTRFNYQKQKIAYYPSNVIGFVEGSDKKDEFVFITAHYDHLGKQGDKIYYGADDDASGTASVIEMAESFAMARSKGKGPRRTVVFMTVSGEEKGLWGSKYYCDHPLFPLDKTSVNLNIDMIGRSDPEKKNSDSINYVYVIGDDKLSSDLKPISTGINNKYARLELDYKFNNPNDPQQIFYRSDHYNFAKKGVPILFYFDGIHNDYHKTTDTPDKINFELLEKRARLIFLTAWEIANRENMLKRDIPLPSLKDD
jgi:hypothetical protein